MTSKTTGPSIYIPTDKNIFDALQHKKVTQAELVAFLRQRGILVSGNSSKQYLVEKISSLTMGYSDFKWIGRLLENPNRKDKVTHSKLKGEIDSEQLKTALDTVKANIISNGDDSAKITKSNGKSALTVTYVDHDFTKTELRQRTVKTCVIQLEESEDGVVMKMPSTKKAKDVADKLKKVLKSQAVVDGKELEEFEITLEAIADASLRSQFFDDLIKNVPDFEFDTVTSVDVYHFDEGKMDDFDDEESAKSRLASYINKAALAGAGVLESNEFKQLHSQGFYIYRIIWTAIDKAKNGPKVEFEAKFGAPDKCIDFMYTVRGLYYFNEKTTEHNVSRKSATPYENEKYNVRLRDASEIALKMAIEAYGE